MKFRFACIAMAATLIAAPVMAQDFAVPIDLPKGATIDLAIEKTTGETRNGEVRPSMTASFRYRQTLRPEGDGYSVRQVMTGSTFPAGAQPNAAESQMLAAAAEIAYVADEALGPVKVLDWPATVDRIFSLIEKADPAAASAAGGQARKMFLDMGPEMAAQVLLKEQNLLAMPQMIALDLGDPLEQKQQVPNPLGGPPIDSVFRVELASIDKASAKAVIRTTQMLDPASAARSMAALMERLGGAASGSASGGLRMERTIVCLYDMDLRTGLTAKVSCDMKAVFGGDGETVERTERTVITQTLVSQP